jgi:light-regulated signal transduction histidine kinase (bacteriophytochrome)
MYFSKKVVEPIQYLVFASRHIAHGDFSIKVPVTSHDEVGQLSESFNVMSTNLQTMLEREKHLAADAAAAETAQRKAAELEEANRRILEKSDELKKVNAELDSFVYTASHDLRAPLRGISSFASFLEDDYKDKIDEEGREYLREIKNGANILQDLIEDLLTLSKISRIRNPYEVVSTQELVKLGVERLRLYIKDHRAEVIVANNLPTIKCDRIKLTEVFVNLINNGIKFSSKNQTNPRIEVGYVEEDKFYKFWVTDNGIGIDPQYHDQIFGIFRRLHTNKEYEGTGAGLTIVRKIVEEHQGQIWIESKEGQGAKFIFTVAKNLQEKKKLGEILLENGAISQAHLDEGLKRQKEQG